MNEKTEQYLKEVDSRCIREKDGIKVILMRRVFPNLSKEYAWARIVEDDFIRVSPVFKSVAQAIYYADEVPLLTDEEWSKVQAKDLLTNIPDNDELVGLSNG